MDLMPFGRGSLLFLSSLQPFVTAAASLFEAFAMKRLEVVKIVDGVKELVQCEEVKPWLEKLQMDQFDSWMTPEMFDEAKKSITRGTPTLLVAGEPHSATPHSPF